MSYLRTNYRITGARVNAVSPGSNAGVYAGTGYVYVSTGRLYIWYNTATYVVFSAAVSGSAADL